jgi:hypothetical protein
MTDPRLEQRIAEALERIATALGQRYLPIRGNPVLPLSTVMQEVADMAAENREHDQSRPGDDLTPPAPPFNRNGEWIAYGAPDLSDERTGRAYAEGLKHQAGENAPAKAAMPNANGWIEWRGGECPVDPHTPVDVRFYGGKTDTTHVAVDWYWHGCGDVGSIFAYRVRAR